MTDRSHKLSASPDGRVAVTTFIDSFVEEFLAYREFLLSVERGTAELHEHTTVLAKLGQLLALGAVMAGAGALVATGVGAPAGAAAAFTTAATVTRGVGAAASAARSATGRALTHASFSETRGFVCLFPSFSRVSRKTL